MIWATSRIIEYMSSAQAWNVVCSNFCNGYMIMSMNNLLCSVLYINTFPTPAGWIGQYDSTMTTFYYIPATELS